MKITLCHSFKDIDTAIVVSIKNDLIKMGHEVFTAPFTESSQEEINRLLADKSYIEKMKPGFIREHLDNISRSDAILVVNLEKNKIKNYVGANTFAEVIFAFYSKKKIFFLNPIPNMDIFSDELKAVSPTIINGDLSLIR
jgi:hypothetical protein